MTSEASWRLGRPQASDSLVGVCGELRNELILKLINFNSVEITGNQPLYF